MTGLRVFPFYLTTNQNSHQEQLRNELALIKCYGGIDVVFDGLRCTLKKYIKGHSPDPIFNMSPNLIPTVSNPSG